MTTTLQKRLALAHVQAAVRELRRAEHQVQGSAGDALQWAEASVKTLATQIAEEAPPPRAHPGVTVTMEVRRG